MSERFLQLANRTRGICSAALQDSPILSAPLASTIQPCQHTREPHNSQSRFLAPTRAPVTARARFTGLRNDISWGHRREKPNDREVSSCCGPSYFKVYPVCIAVQTSHRESNLSGSSALSYLGENHGIHPAGSSLRISQSVENARHDHCRHHHAGARYRR